MLASTLLAIPFVPVFYVVLQRLGGRQSNGESSPLPNPEIPNSKNPEKREPRVSSEE